MIWESGPWKDVLLADADVLERWVVKTKVTSRRSLIVERKVFMAAYTIRKLWEAQKLSTSFRDLSFRCPTYAAISDRITESSNHRLDKLYNLQRSEQKVISMRALIDMIIHSFAFAEFLREDMTVEGFLVTSDKMRYDRLWFIEMEAFISLMRQVGNDYPSTMTAVFDRKRMTGSGGRAMALRHLTLCSGSKKYYKNSGLPIDLVMKVAKIDRHPLAISDGVPHHRTDLPGPVSKDRSVSSTAADGCNARRIAADARPAPPAHLLQSTYPI